MTKDEWIKRCIDRLQLRSGMTYDEARPIAESLYEWDGIGMEASPSDLYTPEEMADSGLEEWPANSDL